jgi:hypothetical protein
MDARGRVRQDSLNLDDVEKNLWLVRAIGSRLLAQARDVSHSIRGRVKAMLNKYPDQNNDRRGVTSGTRDSIR